MRYSRCLFTRIGRATALVALLASVSVSVRATTRGPDPGGYSGTDATAYSFVDISGSSGGAAILGGTDDGVAALTLPFSFRFYGQGYTIVCASSNGALYFVASAAACSAITDFANTDLTTTSPPGDFAGLFPLWSDLTFEGSGAGAVFYQNVGAPGSRKFIVQWNSAYPQGSPNPVTFQLILAEGTNDVLFQYKSVALGPANPASNGGTATIGIRNSQALTNQQQLPWSFGAPVLGDETALLFSSGTSAPVAPVISVTGGSFIYDGNPHPATATATGTGGSAVSGSFAFSYSPGGSTPPINAAAYSVTATFTSSDPGYTNATGTGTITISKATPTITWSNPAAISEGTPLGPAQLNATVNAPGTLAYTPPAGTLLNAGVTELVATFNPSASVNYHAATKAVSITVTPTPGEMEGEGRIDVAGVRHDFEFTVSERANGAERGRLQLEVRQSGRENRKDSGGDDREDRENGDGKRLGVFTSTQLDQVVFSNDPRFQPGSGSRPMIDTATFSGLGRWNGSPGYTFSAQASDAGEPGRDRDLIAITVRDPKGSIVASVSGAISSGNIRSTRVR